MSKIDERLREIANRHWELGAYTRRPNVGEGLREAFRLGWEERNATTRHLHAMSDGEAAISGVPTMVCDRKGGPMACPNHDPGICGLFGGACRSFAGEEES